MSPGRLVLMGSGETAPTMLATHRDAIRWSGARRITLLDTPFGFQENADELVARISRYFRTSLGVEVEVARLRRPDAEPVERERFLAAVRRAEYVFAGPGSPSYAQRIWQPLDLGRLLCELVLSGSVVTLASAAAVTTGRRTLPVYEIYKVGEDPFWLEGLDLTGRLGIPSTVVPHWNNAEGGSHDTSRCYIGRRRLRRLEADLDHGIIGIDEHTALVLDLAEEEGRVEGLGTVTLRGSEGDVVLAAGTAIPLERVRRLLGAPPPPPSRATEHPRQPAFAQALDAGDAEAAVTAALRMEEEAAGDPSSRSRLRSAIVELGEAARAGMADPRALVEGFVEALLELREVAREERRFEEADRIRDRLAELGVEVRDTPDGSEWVLHGGT